MSKIVKQATKHNGKPRKEEIVAELVEKIDNSKGLVFTDYQGLTHIQLEALKKELKKLDATIIIAKNSLLKISLGKSKNYADFKDNEKLNLPTATLFMQGDYVEPLKKVQKSVKDFGLPKIKFGILEGQALDEAQVLKIASLPNRETLLAQLVGTLNSPIQGLVVTLNGTIQKFVMTLGAIAANKPAQNEAVQTETPTVEAPVSETSAEPSETTAPAEETSETPTEEAKPEEEKSEGGEN
jgi:large subunit ribosomal protein L10